MYENKKIEYRSRSVGQLCFTYLIVSFYLHMLLHEDEREGDDDGCGAGIRDPADNHRKAIV